MTIQNMGIFGVSPFFFQARKRELNGEERKCTYSASAVVCVVSVWNNVGIRDVSSSSD